VYVCVMCVCSSFLFLFLLSRVGYVKCPSLLLSDFPTEAISNTCPVNEMLSSSIILYTIKHNDFKRSFQRAILDWVNEVAIRYVKKKSTSHLTSLKQTIRRTFKPLRYSQRHFLWNFIFYFFSINQRSVLIGVVKVWPTLFLKRGKGVF
jgi:hypothetical protein